MPLELAGGPSEVGEKRRWDSGSIRSLAVVLLLTLLWRVPSFFDPPWVNDEGTYFAVAQAMSHGYRLYVDVWENKPPAIYLLYGAVYHPFGPSLLGVRLLTTLAVLLIVTLTYRLATAFAGERAAAGAALIAGLLFGVPFIEGTTANAEVFLALFSALAVFLVLLAGRGGAGGAAVGIAILFKSVAAFDAAALGIWILQRCARTGKEGREQQDRHVGVTLPAPTATWLLPGVFRSSALLLPFVIGCASVLGACVLLVALVGNLGAMLRDALFYDIGYVGHGNGGGVPWLLVLKLLLLLLATGLLRERPFPYLWLVWAGMGALFSGRPFGHYFLQAIVPACLCLAMLMRARPLVPVRVIPCLFLVGACLAASVGWGMAVTGHDTILARRLQYYSNFARLALGREPYAMYRGQVDDHVERTIAVAGRLRGLRHGRLLVWGNSPWIYPLSGLLPATPYTSALRTPEVPGETATLRGAVQEGKPSQVVLINPPLPALGAPVRRALLVYYQHAGTAENATLYTRAR